MRKDTKESKKKPPGQFFQTRMDALGLTTDNNQISLKNPEAEFPVPAVFKIPIFEEDNKGNIAINFYDLDSQRIIYYKKGNGKMSAHNQKPKDYQQIRLREPKGDMKYVLPRGQGIFPFLPPLIIEAWKNKAPIHTLYLTEGAFKAWKACLFDIYTIGLTSITHYRDSETKELHHDIIRFIIECQVQRVVILWDGDCRNISQNHLRDMVDITKRPRDFFNTIKSIRQLLLNIELPEDRSPLQICFFHVNSHSMPDAPKGLDDILIEGEKMGNVKAVTQELLKPKFDRQFYFFKLDITDSTTTLFHYFKLQDVHTFFNFHLANIQNTRFEFQRDFWAWNEKKSKLELVAPGWSTEIKWIGNNFYREVFVPVSDGEKQRDFLQMSKQTLVDLYGKNFQKYLKYFKGFCNIPSHFDYQAEHGEFYNSYRPLAYQPIEGDCSITLDFIKHIFGEHTMEYDGQTYTNYELGLDYLQLMLTQPQDPLPVLILYSPENNTGKSTFGDWQSTILGENAINVSNNDLKSNFNAHWVKKLLIYCEETLLEKKFDSEMIKAKSTSKKTTCNAKGINQKQAQFCGKFQLYSNNKRMININKHDERYWIRQIPQPAKVDPNLSVKLRAEIPAFLYFIKNRKLRTERISRMHFASQLIITATFHEVVRISEPSDAQSLREHIKMMFLDFNQDEIYLPIKSINQEFFNSKAQIPRLKQILKDFLLVDQNRDDHGVIKQVRGHYYRWERGINQLGEESDKKRTIKFNGRPYVFHRKDFVKAHEEHDKKRVTIHSDNQRKPGKAIPNKGNQITLGMD
jgi:hypothetical protein